MLQPTASKYSRRCRWRRRAERTKPHSARITVRLLIKILKTSLASTSRAHSLRNSPQIDRAETDLPGLEAQASLAILLIALRKSHLFQRIPPSALTCRTNNQSRSLSPKTEISFSKRRTGGSLTWRRSTCSLSSSRPREATTCTAGTRSCPLAS